MAQGISGSTSRRQVLVAGAALAATAAASPALAQATAADGPRVAIIAGTSSGFGRLMAESFARRGITVIKTMRDAGGRNSGPAEELRGLPPDPSLDSREIVEAAPNLVATPPGSRPARVVVGPYRDGIERLNSLHVTVQAEMAG
ncbi:hypothetical protein [Paracoccus siganidrum]|nr:hypothetical protein [Paracoccus siganidrum]RMC39221.1 hypothetical protein C9E82_04280 [Paracoccus siganidrum]